MVLAVPEYNKMFVKCNCETLIIQGPNPKDVRKVHSYPSCAKTLRGSGGDVVYLEEAAFMSLDVFFEVVVPVSSNYSYSIKTITNTIYSY